MPVLGGLYKSINRETSAHGRIQKYIIGLIPKRELWFFSSRKNRMRHILNAFNSISSKMNFSIWDFVSTRLFTLYRKYLLQSSKHNYKVGYNMKNYIL